MNLIKKIKKRAYKIIHKPISVYAFHQVSNQFDAEVDCKTDWNSVERFERNVEWIQQHNHIISLDEAIQKLESGKRLRKNYVVITFDDGYSSVKNGLKILEQRQLPATIFINSGYLDDRALSSVNVVNYFNSKNPEELNSYPPELVNAVKHIDLCQDEITYRNYYSIIRKHLNLIQLDKIVYLTRSDLSEMNSSLFTIALHGYEHINSAFMDDNEFQNNIHKDIEILKCYPNFMPYYAFPFGSSDDVKIEIVRKMGYVPFLCNGLKNYKSETAYNRISVDGLDLSAL